MSPFNGFSTAMSVWHLNKGIDWLIDWLDVLTGKALSVRLEFIDETGEKIFLFTDANKTCVTLISWHVHK